MCSSSDTSHTHTHPSRSQMAARQECFSNKSFGESHPLTESHTWVQSHSVFLSSMLGWWFTAKSCELSSSFSSISMSAVTPDFEHAFGFRRHEGFMSFHIAGVQNGPTNYSRDSPVLSVLEPIIWQLVPLRSNLNVTALKTSFRFLAVAIPRNQETLPAQIHYMRP